MSAQPAGPGRWSLRLVPTAYRVKTRVNRALSDHARRRGWTITAIGQPGYAAGGRARVRGRLLIVPAGTDPNARRDIPAGGGC